MRIGLSWVVAASIAPVALGCGDDRAGEDEVSSTETSSGETGEACAPTSAAVGEGPGAQQLELVATRAEIPGLADQPTAHGQALASLQAFDGRLHFGYGDYDQNTGPISMYAWDPALDEFLEFGLLPGEEVRGFLAAHGAIYGPALDHDGHQEDGGVYRLDCGSPTWAVETPIPGAVHVYGLSVQGETLYAGTGSLTGAPARVMASDDRGASWTEVLRHESPLDGFSRFYTTAANSSLLFALGRELPDGEVFAWVRHGEGGFEPVTDPPEGTLAPIVLADEIVLVELSAMPGFGSYITSYQVEGQGLLAVEPWPALDGSQLVSWALQPTSESAPERLIVMMKTDAGSVSIHRSADLLAGPQGWEALASLDAPGVNIPADDVFTSIALLDNDLYLGTRAGSLWALRELEQPAE